MRARVVVLMRVRILVHGAAQAEVAASEDAAAASPGSPKALDAEEARFNWKALKEELAEEVLLPPLAFDASAQEDNSLHLTNILCLPVRCCAVEESVWGGCEGARRACPRLGVLASSRGR